MTMTDQNETREALSGWAQKGFDDNLAQRPYREFSSIASDFARSEYWKGWQAAAKYDL